MNKIFYKEKTEEREQNKENKKSILLKIFESNYPQNDNLLLCNHNL